MRVSLNNWADAQKAYADHRRACAPGMPGYGADVEREAEYYLGVAAMGRRQYEEALRHLYRCDELSRDLDSRRRQGS